MDHIGELRRRFTIVVVSLLITSLVIYFATPTLIEIMLDPIRDSLPEGQDLTVISVLGGLIGASRRHKKRKHRAR
jgi:sec-independent protein translocase protein TatC